MSTRTISEKFFEKLCSTKCVGFVRIPETAEKTADYRVSLGSVTLITEVKQLELSNEDKELAKVWGTLKSPGAVAPSGRVQRLLEEGYPQVKRSSEGKCPTMIVVYNNSADWNWIDPFTVTNAMFGLYGSVLKLQPNQKIAVAGQGYFGKRKVTKDTFRFLSVVGVLKQVQADTLALDCHHNPFANLPIEHTVLADLADAQYIHPNPHDRGFVPWEPKKIET